MWKKVPGVCLQDGREATLEGDGGKNLLEGTLDQKDPRARREPVRGVSAGKGSQAEGMCETYPPRLRLGRWYYFKSNLASENAIINCIHVNISSPSASSQKGRNLRVVHTVQT